MFEPGLSCRSVGRVDHICSSSVSLCLCHLRDEKAGVSNILAPACPRFCATRCGRYPAINFVQHPSSTADAVRPNALLAIAGAFPPNICASLSSSLSMFSRLAVANVSLPVGLTVLTTLDSQYITTTLNTGSVSTKKVSGFMLFRFTVVLGLFAVCFSLYTGRDAKRLVCREIGTRQGVTREKFFLISPQPLLLDTTIIRVLYQG